MQRKKPITPFGWEIKRRLAELEMDQKTFCELYDIPPSRLSNLINGTRKASKHRRQVSQLLGLSEFEAAGSAEEKKPLEISGTRR
ncbi:hypothetical protein QWJ34_02470 [Saccharibacillus sp. CPCC 101409]|uniref:hypothetical protein n=1 Tax=Saccharibacillus sp. CPCC 101409 TaxID=3058041 RepID=UPI00267109B2|nr:hypothetical protein [Saccharibacillus sp. CPCC 101409]MDO3408623.1 hypothetical protein [Saccharibacillus sp. CPCC 101409]